MPKLTDKQANNIIRYLRGLKGEDNANGIKYSNN